MLAKMVKLSLCLIHYATRHEGLWGNTVIAPVFLASVLDEEEWSASRPGHFIPGERGPVPIEY
jgi:hypothetical protein